MALYRRRRWHRIYILIFLFIIFLLLYFLNKSFVATIYSYQIKDIPSESLEKYFMLEEEHDIQWYYFALMDDGRDAPKENFKDFIIEYKSQGQDIQKTFDHYKKGKFKNYPKRVKKYERIDRVLREKDFPIPENAIYEYDNGWGAERTYGGERSHEGIDIITDKGVPIHSVGDGIVEKIGWNELGGWRLGIRGDDRIYYYYAHLDRYENNIKKGDKVEKGEIIGFVGDTGYGPEGTRGMFADHLHFGMYENNRAINPYPFLNAWERR